MSCGLRRGAETTGRPPLAFFSACAKSVPMQISAAAARKRWEPNFFMECLGSSSPRDDDGNTVAQSRLLGKEQKETGWRPEERAKSPVSCLSRLSYPTSEVTASLARSRHRESGFP